jgi:hypothetical protein
VKLWFQIVLAIGILAISAASLVYVWQTWRAYRLETRAEELCKFYLERNLEKGTDVDSNIEHWFDRRQCVNEIMGKGSGLKSE